jgi:type III secretory pathway component EscT
VLPPDVVQYLSLLGWGAARSLPLVWLIPAFSGPAVPVGVRLALGIALSGLCLPALSGRVPEEPAVSWILLAAREVLVGCVMGFICACWFRGAEVAGRLVDLLRGADLAVMVTPTGRGRSSPFAALMLLIAVVIFFEIGGPGHLCVALTRSYEAVPLAAPAFGVANSWSIVVAVILASAKLFEAALGLCAPVVVSLLLADLVMGLLGRAVPQIPADSLVGPLKALLGVGVVLLGLGSIGAAMRGSLGGFFALLRAAMGV